MAISKTTLILRDLAEHLSLQKHRSALYISNPVFIVRGIIIEQTSYKDTIYVRLLNLGFFSAFPVIHVNYSPRIESSKENDYFRGTPADIAALSIASVKRSGLTVPFIANPSPVEFLTIIDHLNIDRTSSICLLDQAACRALLGQTDAAIHGFTATKRRIQADLDQFSRGEWASTDAARCRRFVDMLRAGQDITMELRRLCYHNAVRLGFKPAPLPADDING